MRPRYLSLIALTTFTSLVHAAPATPADLAAAKGKQCALIREDLLKAAPATIIARETYTTALIAPLSAILADKNADARLNAAILIADLHTLSSDALLTAMLSNPDPCVRYWAAKGLANIAPIEKRVGPPTVIVAALNAAQTAEPDPIVAAQLTTTLAAY